ncbi:MAG: hypothetical protein M1347_07485 [Chloroflexi bacterium]|nr:hypothetical protein [Chloroflexota bacterium]
MFVKPISFSRKWLVPILLGSTLLLAACGGGSPTDETGEEATTAPDSGGADSGAEPTAAANEGAVIGACANPYFPVVNGATWTYSVTGGIQDFSYTDTITNVSAEGFTLNSSFDLEGGLQRTQAWGCQANGLVALEYNGGPSAALSTEALNAEFHTTGVTGVTIPTNLSVGSSWTQAMDIEGDMTIGEGLTGAATGNVSFAANAVGTESVSTAAGTFDAIKVEIQQDFSLTANIGGVSMPVTFTGTTTAWYASGVGMVKSVVTEDLMGSTTTIELQSYSIP